MAAWGYTGAVLIYFRALLKEYGGGGERGAVC